jgi:hypothetical protein
MRKPGFWQVFFGWLVLAAAVYVLNSLTIQNAPAQRCVMASLGVFLLIRPVWPASFAVYYDEITCRRLIRVCAAMEIVSSFAVRPFF